ncbi:MAG: Rossmann-like and DUF2520 domain-containing protein [Cyclobacteriaceae bacterium]
MSLFSRKKDYYKIAMIGAGKVASQLAPALEDAGHSINVVFSRHKRNAETLASRLYAAEATNQLDFSRSEAQVFILSVKDDALSEVAKEISLPEGALLLHTAGGRPMDVLAAAICKGIGVLYPLQTFSKEKEVNFKKIPLLIEAADKSTFRVVRNLAESIGKNVHEVDSESRAMIHVAAIFACNFSNHMMHIANYLMDKNGLDFAWLQPLITDTFQKALAFGPAKTQTGPAARNDRSTMIKHLEQLQDDEPELAQLYRQISEGIHKFSDEKR